MESLTLLYPPQPPSPPLPCFSFIVSIIVVIKHRKLTNYEPENRFVPSIYFPRCIVIMNIFSPIFHTKSLSLTRPRLKSVADSPLNRGVPTGSPPWPALGADSASAKPFLPYSFIIINWHRQTHTHVHYTLIPRCPEPATTGEVPTSASGYALLTRRWSRKAWPGHARNGGLFNLPDHGYNEKCASKLYPPPLRGSLPAGLGTRSASASAL